MANATTRPVTELSRAIRRDTATLASAIGLARQGSRRSVHRARVASRRLREALPTAAEALRQDVEVEARELRRITRALGPLREMDVVRAVLADCARRHDWPPAAVARVDTHCAHLREVGRAELADTLGRLDLPALVARLEGLAEVLAHTPREDAVAAVVGLRVRQRARALARAVGAAGTVYAAEPLHEVRIAAKKLRYALELRGEDAAGIGSGLAVRRLKRLQTLLGHLHDAQTVQHRIQEVASAVADRRLMRTLGLMGRVLESRCRDWHGQLLKRLPRIDQLTDEILEHAPARLPGRLVGRPARMSVGHTARRRAREA